MNFEELKEVIKVFRVVLYKVFTLEESNKHIVSFPVMETDQADLYLEREQRFLKFFAKLLQVEQPTSFSVPEEGPDPSKIFRF